MNREWRCERFAELDRLISDEDGAKPQKPTESRSGRRPGSLNHHREQIEAYAAKMRAGKTAFFRRRLGKRGQWGTGPLRRELAIQSAAHRPGAA
jgi:hypothetical protein